MVKKNVFASLKQVDNKLVEVILSLSKSTLNQSFKNGTIESSQHGANHRYTQKQEGQIRF